MLTHYLKPYGRSFRKNYVTLTMAIGGFALGLAVFVLSLEFISGELDFDGFHRNQDSIYRIVYGEDDERGSAYTSFVMGSILEESFPDVRAIRFNNAGGMRIPASHEDKKFVETRFYFTDPEVFDVFSFVLLKGDPETCLRAPFTTVITPAMAARYFGTDNPIGKSLKIDWVGTDYDLEVTGIVNPPPPNSHLQFEFLISNATAEQVFTPKTFFTDWTANFCYNYVYIPDGRADVVASALHKAYTKAVPADQRTFYTRLQPLSRIHLYSKLMAEHSRNSDILYVYIAASLGLLVIAVAFINYISIELAAYSKRLKELGVRKVIGASLGELGLQFSAECLINFVVACGLALAFIQLASSYYSEVLGGGISLRSLRIGNLLWVALGLLGLALLLVSYLVYALSRLKPSELLANRATLLRGQRNRSIWVGLQVGVSLMLIVGGLAMKNQLTFLEERDLGYDREHVVTLPYGRVITEKIELARNELVDETTVKSMTLSSQIPPSNLNFKVACFPEGGNPEGTTNAWNVAMVVVDENFAETFGLELIDGRTFSDNFRVDTAESFLINETFAKELGWAEPLGKRIEANFNAGTGKVEQKRGQVVGVLKDFHFESLHKPISPVLFIYRPSAFFYASFRLTPGELPRKIEQLRGKWESLFPEAPFDYFFISTRLEGLYKAERSWLSNVASFTAIAIAISLFGVFSLVSFLVQSRQSEFAIRKVLGASGFSIAGLVGVDVLRIVLLAFCLAAPICYLAIDSWLAAFAFRVELSAEVFLLSLLCFISLCGLVMAGSLVKASRTSVVENLKSE